MSETLRAARVPALAEVPGLVHGFEQRPGPAGWEERDDARRRVASALERSGPLFLLKQVHGARVRRAPWTGRPEADAAVAEAPGALLGIETADCLPVLVVDPVRRAVAAAHAGWRGTAAGVSREAVAALVAGGSRTEDLIAATGPGIGPCCYEVGDELRSAFGERGADFFRPEAGIPEARIHRVADCTRCRADLYQSYRRDGKNAGRMINYIGFTAENAE
jgi:copper oxidase (laccase) domain-containing protein